MSTGFQWRHRWVAAGLHTLISGAIACLAALLVFSVWYPGSFRLLAGGQNLFSLVATVDVILGPLLTLVVFDTSKDRRELKRDVATIGIIQIAALIYGLHIVYAARPIAMVFEVDRLRLVTAKDVQVDELSKAPAQFRTLPLTGPWLLGTRATTSIAEHNDALFLGLAGVDISSRPQFWKPYELSKAQALARSRPLTVLFEKYPDRAADLRDHLFSVQVDVATARFLPVMARESWWSGVLDANGAVVAYLPVDGFF